VHLVGCPTRATIAPGWFIPLSLFTSHFPLSHLRFLISEAVSPPKEGPTLASSYSYSEQHDPCSPSFLQSSRTHLDTLLFSPLPHTCHASGPSSYPPFHLHHLYLQAFLNTTCSHRLGEGDRPGINWHRFCSGHRLSNKPLPRSESEYFPPVMSPFTQLNL
jgi:hypothetical protein